MMRTLFGINQAPRSGQKPTSGAASLPFQGRPAQPSGFQAPDFQTKDTLHLSMSADKPLNRSDKTEQDKEGAEIGSPDSQKSQVKSSKNAAVQEGDGVSSEDITDADIEALKQDPVLQKQAQQFIDSTKEKFFQKAELLASEPDWADLLARQKAGDSSAVQAKLKAVSQQLGEFINILASAISKKLVQDFDAVLQGREENQLSKAEKLEVVRLQMLRNTYTSFLQKLADQRMTVFSQILNQALRPADASKSSKTQKTVEGSSEEILACPKFQQELANWTQGFKERFRDQVIKLISHPKFQDSQLGTGSMTDAEMDTLLAGFNRTINVFLRQAESDINREFQAQAHAIVGPDVDLDETSIESLPPDQQEAIMRLQLLSAEKERFLKEFDPSNFYEQIKEDFFTQKQQERWQPVNKRLDALRGKSDTLNRMIDRCLSMDKTIRANGYDQLLAYLSSGRSEQRTLLPEVIRLAAHVPNADVKVHAAEAILRVADEDSRKSLMKEWLASPNINDKLAILKLFTFTQRDGTGAISAAAYRLLDAHEDLRTAFEALRENPHPQVQEWLGLIEQHYALLEEKQRKAKANQPGKGRLFSFPKR